MFKKIVFVSLILLGIISLLIANKYSVRAHAAISEEAISLEIDPVEAAYIAADELYNNKKYEQARQAFQDIADNQPQTEPAMRSLCGVAKVSIMLGEDAAADTAVDSLLADFSDAAGIAEAACKIADQYYQLKKHQKADNLYKKIVDDWPGDEYAMWSQMHLAMSDVRDENDVAAEKSMEKLLANYSEQYEIEIALCQVADTYSDLHRDYKKSDAIYEYVVKNWPDTEHAIWAHAYLTMSAIRDGNTPAVEAGIYKLLSDYPQNKFISNALCSLGDEYSKFKGHEKADDLYRMAIAYGPVSEGAMWSRMRLAMSAIRGGYYDAAEMKIDEMLANYPKDKLMTTAVYLIADKYRIAQQYEKGRQFYQKVMANWSESENPAQREMLAIISEGHLGDDATFAAVIDKLCNTFIGRKSEELLSPVLYRAAEQYYNRGFELVYSGLDEEALKEFERVAVIWEKTTNEFNFSVLKPNVGDICRAGDAYKKLGQFGESIACFERVLDEYPRFKYTWHALYTIGDNYDALGKENIVLQEEAILKTRQAYTQLIEKYPTCPVAEKAQQWLNDNN